MKKRPKKNVTPIQLPDNLSGILCCLAVLLGCFWCVRLTNLFGDEGSACFFCAADWFFLLFAMTGLGLYHAVYEMTASRMERLNYFDAVRVVKSGLFYGLIVGIAACLAGFLLSGLLCDRLCGIPEAAATLRLFLPALPLLSLLLVCLGALDGVGRKEQAQVVCILFCLLLFILGPVFTNPLLSYGQKVGALLQNSFFGPAYGAMGGAAALLVSAFVSLIAAVFLWLRYKPSLRESMYMHDEISAREGNLYQGLLFKAAPCLLPATILGFALIGQMVLFRKVSGDADTAIADWGIYTGKSRMLLALCVLAATAFAVRMLPQLKLGYLSRNLKKTRERCMVTLRCSALLCVPLTIFAAIAAKPVISSFFSEGNTETAADLLRIGSVCIVLYGIAAALGAILIGMDMLKSVAADMLLSVVLHLFLLYGMLHFLGLGIIAVVYANIVLSFFLCLLFFLSLQRHQKVRINWLRVFLAPAVGAVIMAAVCGFLVFVVLKSAPDTVNMLVSGLVSFLFYAASVIVLKGATPRELRAFPGGEKMIAAARMLRLM